MLQVEKYAATAVSETDAITMNETDAITVSETELPKNAAVNRVEQVFGKIYHALGVVTRPKIEANGVPTSLPTRADRADLYHKITKINRAKNGVFDGQTTREYGDEQSRFVLIEKEFHNQKALSINHPEYGELKACYVVLNEHASLSNPPIIFIPGTINAVESVDTFVREISLAEPSRRIIVLAYPEAPSGLTTEKFYQAVKTADDFTPHSVIFKSMIKHLLPEGDFELWGYSAGAAITSILSADQTFANRIANAALICPWGANGQTRSELIAGTLHDSLQPILQKSFAKYAYIDDASRGEQREQKKLKTKIWKALINIGSKSLLPEQLSAIKLKESGVLAIISGGNDQITKSAQLFSEPNEKAWQKQNPAIKIAVLQDELHEGPLLHAETFVQTILQTLGREATPFQKDFSRKNLIDQSNT